VSRLKVFLVLSMVVGLADCFCSFMCWGVAEEFPGGNVFRFVWSDVLGSYPVFGGYYIVSDRIFTLKVYALSLSNVGNYRLSNHSAVIEGVRQAVKIYPRDGQIKELIIPISPDLVMKLNVSISLHIIEDWETYKALVESANNTIIVNTHDEYLPVPEGYTKEEWTDKIADFMLNRWGTWVHAGGYPLYRVWHQNGTTEEWGENGFKHLMSHIGKANVTCYPPPGQDPTNSTDPAVFSIWASQDLGPNWCWKYDDIMGPIHEFHYSAQGYPININDFLSEGLFSGGIFSYGDYYPGAITRFSQNRSTFNFGLYIHMSPWQYYNIDGDRLPSDFALGFISTAAAIYEEFSYAACKLYGRLGDSAMEAILEAEKEGRTVWLTEAKTLFQNALDAFASGNYKLSAAYAIQAKQTAENATAPNTLPQTIAMITTIIAIPIAIGAYHKINNKRKDRKEGVTKCVE
jgi:hypothetical protein